MKSVNLDEAKTQLSQLVDEAASGKDVIVSRHGKPVARITQLAPSKSRITYGLMQGQVKVAKDFDTPLPPDVLDAFPPTS